MSDSYSLAQVSVAVLLRQASQLAAHERTNMAWLLAHIAEIDERRLYLPAGYPSMHLYCVHELRLSDDAIYKRIQAARTARRFPAIFAALTEGQLHLSGIVLLAPHLSEQNAERLLGESSGKSKSEIEAVIARYFPRTESLPMVETLTSSAIEAELAPGRVAENSEGSVVKTPSGELAPGRVPPARVEPIAQARYRIPLTIGQSALDKLRHAQELLSHQVPDGDIAAVFERALDALIEKAEKRKFAATDKPRRCKASSGNSRHVPADVKRAVRERDGDQCTFTSAVGHRCPARKHLEFDHALEVARGGKATVENVRLRCRAHNQYTAEQSFGRDFMRDKREQARRAAAEAKAREAERERARAEAERQRARAEAERQRARAKAERQRARAEAERRDRNLILCLRRLGFRVDEARSAAAHCETLPATELEPRVLAALAYLAPRAVRIPAPSSG